jgi:hypothetical protein
MAAAYLLVAETDAADIFCCSTCAEKRQRGCVRPRREPIQVYFCPICDGENKKCSYCKGTNQIKLKRCPRAILDTNTSRLVSYFRHFVNTSQYPDGRGILYQSVRMLRVFDIWGRVLVEEKKKKEPKE